MAQDQVDGGGLPGLGDAFKLLTDVGAKLADSARSMADDLAQSPAAPLARLSQQLVELSLAWVGPVRSILEEQQELVDAVATWAETQQALAERFADLAERHRALTEQTMSVIQPVLDTVDKLNLKRD